MRSNSLRYRLLRRLLWPLLLMLAVGEGVAYFFALRVAVDSYDMNVLDDALDLAKQVSARDGRLVLDLPIVAKQMLQNNNGDQVIYVVADEARTVIAGDARLLRAIALIPDNYSFSDANIDGREYRQIILRAKAGEKMIVVVVAETTNNRNRLMTRFFVSMLMLGFILVAVAVAIILSGVRKGLQPLQALHDEIVSRSANDLRPIAELNAAQELKVIIHGINELLAKLAASLSEHRRFIANASHQLRTPLSALSSQIEVALASPSGDVGTTLQQLLDTTRRTAHLANQFLSLARLENTEQFVSEQEEVDINSVIRDVTSDYLPIAAKKGVELSFDLVPARIMGSRLLLNELLSNILDNAIRYVPVNGCVHVSSCQRGGGLQLTVADNGPGVATTDFEKLGVPFYRLTSKEPDGSGLGLAIAIEIARLHDAEVFFSAGIGGVGFGVNIFFAKILRVS